MDKLDEYVFGMLSKLARGQSKKRVTTWYLKEAMQLMLTTNRI
jgi:hypothetical protein